MLGIISAIALLVRPNLLLIVAYLMILHKSKFMLNLFFLICTYCLISYSFTGKYFYWPSQGGYALYVSANPGTKDALLKDFSPELSKDIYPSNDYFHDAISWIKNNPMEYAELCGLKLFTFLRPDTRYIHNSRLPYRVVLVGQYILAMPFFLWLFFSRKYWQVVLLYILPFIFMAADPRYRIPLDVFLFITLLYEIQDHYTRCRPSGA